MLIAPHLPSDWPSERFERYRVGASSVSGEIVRQKGSIRIKLAVKGKALKVQFAPALPPGSTLVGATFNGRRAVAKLEASDTDVHVMFEADSVQQAELVIRVREGVELQPPLITPEPGDKPRAARLIDTKVDSDKISFELAGPAGTNMELKAWRGDQWTREGGEVPVRFPPGDGFTRATVVYRRSGK